MHKFVLVPLLVLSVAILEVTCMDTMLTPPPRPTKFTSPAQLRAYLTALNEYYSIVGRPRFGKRNRAMNIPDSGLYDKRSGAMADGGIFGKSLPDSEIYEKRSGAKSLPDGEGFARFGEYY